MKTSSCALRPPRLVGSPRLPSLVRTFSPHPPPGIRSAVSPPAPWIHLAAPDGTRPCPPPPRLSSSSSPDSIARAATCVGVSGFLIRPDPSRSSPVSSPPAPSYGACVCSLFGFGRLGSPFLGFHGRCKSGSRLLLVSWWRCFDGLLVQESCPSVKNILLLDSEGKRVAVKYYTDDWPTLSAKLAFEKSVFVKTQKATAGAEGNAHLPPLSACDSEWQLRRWLVSDD